MEDWESNQLDKNGIEFLTAAAEPLTRSDEPNVLEPVTTTGARTTPTILPVVEHREELLNLINNNQVVIVCGETGSGKSTQIPQFLAQTGLVNASQKLAVTQPRRLAASSLAARVAQEMQVTLGLEVGYSVRFDNHSDPKKTIIKFLTDGTLLRECIADPQLLEYGALLIDEAHERTVDTDLLLGLLSQLLPRRPEFKLVISSATLDADKLAAFFESAPVYTVPGRAFPVDLFYTKSSTSEISFRDLCVSSVAQLHSQQPLDGDILAFLPGQSDIEIVEDKLVEEAREWSRTTPELIIVPLYATMAVELQSKVFKPTPKNCRKVILATNVAETSLTVPGIRYVIDTGLVKQLSYNPHSGMDSLEVVSCSQASAKQRAGRAGRTGPGQCYRLYSRTEFARRPELTEPEILRSNLSQVCLLLLTLGVEDSLAFPWLDSPSMESIINALQLLYALGAVNQHAQLTKVGRVLAEFPLDPRLAKTLLVSLKSGLSEEIATIAAMLGELGNIYITPKGQKPLAQLAHSRFQNAIGDHFSLLEIYKQWQASGFSRQWCREHFIQLRALQRAKKIRESLLQLTARIQKIALLDTSSQLRDNVATLIECLVSGYFMHLARISKNNQEYVAYHLGTAVSIHPSSMLWDVRPPPKLVLYHELLVTSKEYMRGCLVVDAEVVRKAAPQFYYEKITNNAVAKRPFSTRY